MRSLVACACLLGSASAQGYGVLALPYTASWVAPSYYAGPWVPAGSSPTNFVCRVALPGGGGFVAGRANAAVSSCVAPINGSEYTTPIATGALVLDSRLAWSNSGAPLPPESVLVSAGAPYLSQPSYVCRGVPPAAPGAVSGSTTGAVLGAVGAPVCLVAVGGGRLAALVAPAFDYLVGFPSDASLQPPAAGLQPAVPSSSPTPTITTSATPSPTVLAGGSVSWYSASLGYAGAAVAGAEGVSSIFVCAGRLSTGDIVPGKYESIWSFCDISVEGVEVNDASYTLLRASPWLMWAAAVPSGTSYWPYRPPVVGAVPVVGGSYMSRALTVCRAWHPTARTGPHSGFVDGVTVSPVTNTPACLFSWGRRHRQGCHIRHPLCCAHELLCGSCHCCRCQRHHRAAAPALALRDALAHGLQLAHRVGDAFRDALAAATLRSRVGQRRLVRERHWGCDALHAHGFKLLGRGCVCMPLYFAERCVARVSTSTLSGHH